jgi:APA family basic amino acid/polyamine antiporter
LTPSSSKISWKTAAGLVIANMIGTGVFTSLGFQLEVVQNTWTILLLWTLGGGMALIGALVYAELGTHFKRTGGDYIFLSETIHPAVGYLYAWVSLVVGFSAPIAIAAMAMNNYLSPIFGETILPGLLFLVGVPVFICCASVAIVIYVLIIGFLVACISGYFVGLVGSTNSPLSGILIITVLLLSFICLSGLLLPIYFNHSTKKTKQHELINRTKSSQQSTKRSPKSS